MHQLPFTALLNHLFAGPVTALLTALGLHPAHPTAPIPDHVAMQIMVFLILILFFVAVRASLSVEKPNTVQHMMESVYEFMDAQSEEIIGHENKRYLSYLITLDCSSFSAICWADPVLRDRDGRACGSARMRHCDLVLLPRARHSRQRPWDMSSISWARYWWLAPLMFLIEVCSHLASLMSLTVRLFRQYVCRRHGDSGVLLADTDWHTCDLHLASTSAFR